MRRRGISWPQCVVITLVLASLGFAWLGGWAVTECAATEEETTDFYWTGYVGTDWGDPNNWSPSGGPPAEGHNAWLSPYMTNWAEYRNIFPVVPTLSGLFVYGSYGPMTLLLNQTGLEGELQVSSASISYGGTIQQAAGNAAIFGTLAIAGAPGSPGSYVLSGGNLNALTIQLDNNGIFNQTGGTLLAPTFLQIGGDVQGSLQNQGDYIYSGGTFSGRLLNYGTVNFTGSFTADNGLAQLSGTTLHLASGNTMTLNGQGLEVDQGAKIRLWDGATLNTTTSILGNAGEGIFDHSGGSHTVSNTLILGSQVTGEGLYALALGTLTVNGELVVGDQGSAIFSQWGGTLLAQSDLYLGKNLGASEFGPNSAYFGQIGGSTTVNGTLFVGYQGDPAGSFAGYHLINDAQLATQNTVVGQYMPGYFMQAGTSQHVVAGELTIGFNAWDVSTYQLNEGSLQVAGNMTLGKFGGTGQFFQTGGAITVGGDLILGQNGYGYFEKTDGDLMVAGLLNLGKYLGTGEFLHQGGNTFAGYLQLGEQGTGIFTQTGGSLTNTLATIGYAGSGTFNLLGGTHTVTDTLTIAATGGSTGTYNLEGGSLSAATIKLNAGGVFNQTGGTLNYTTFNHQGGEVTGSLQNQGHYSYTSGLFSGRLLNYGTATFNGDFTAGNGLAQYSATPITLASGSTMTLNGQGLEVDQGGVFNLAGGTLNTTTSIIGNTGAATFNHSSGSHNVSGALTLAANSGSTGIYNFSGGTINAQTMNLNAGWIFNWTGGTLLVQTVNQTGGVANASGTVDLGNLEIPFTYNLSGGTINAQTVNLFSNGTFNQTGGSFNYTTFNQLGGTVLGSLQNQGAFNYTSGLFGGRLLNYGTATFSGDFTAGNGLAQYSATPLTMSSGFTMTLNGQGLEVDQGGVFNLNGGTLNTTASTIGNTGAGTFNQSSGSHTVAGGLTLAAASGSSGTYNLSGGTLTAGSIAVNQGGALNLSGGTLTPNGTFTVGAGGTFAQSNGIVDGTSNTLMVMEGTGNLSGGTLRPGSGLTVRGGGAFNQTGGVVDGTSNTVLITEGTYNLSGGTCRPGNAMTVQNGGIFNQTGGILDGASSTVSIFEGVCNVAGGDYNADTLNIYTGGSLNWTGGTFSYNTLNLAGGSLTFTGNLTNTGTLGGTGTINGNIINQGTLSPGSSPGTLTINGTLTQSASGTFLVEIESATSYDKINVVSGAKYAVSLNGTLKPVLLGGFVPTENQRFAGIITADGVITGKFSTISSILTWTVQYNPTSVDLIYGGLDYANDSLNLSDNQTRLGNLFNQLFGSADGDLAAFLNRLATLDGSQVGAAYQEILPERAAALAALSLTGATLQWQNMANRLSYQRWLQGGIPNLTGRGGAFNFSYNKLAGLMLAYNSADLSGLVSGPGPKTRREGTWEVFADLLSSFGKQADTANMTGYRFTILGFNVGADYRLRDDLVLGLGTGYYHTNAPFQGSGGDVGISSIPFFGYGAYTPGSFYVMGSLGYTLNLYSLERVMALFGVNRVANSSVTGNQFNAALETGYDFKIAQCTVTPAATMFFSQAWVGGCTESGAGILDLKIDPQSANSLQAGVGLRLARPFQAGEILVLPQLSAFYQHEFANNSRGLDARLAQVGNTFTFQTDSPSRNFAVLGAGLALGLKKNLTLRVNYNTEVGRRGYSPQMVSAGMRYEF